MHLTLTALYPYVMAVTVTRIDRTSHVGRRVYNAQEVAEALGRSTRTIRRHIKRGELPAVKAGRSFIITRTDLAEYLESEKRVDAIFGPEDDTGDE